MAVDRRFKYWSFFRKLPIHSWTSTTRICYFNPHPLLTMERPIPTTSSPPQPLQSLEDLPPLILQPSPFHSHPVSRPDSPVLPHPSQTPTPPPDPNAKPRSAFSDNDHQTIPAVAPVRQLEIVKLLSTDQQIRVGSRVSSGIPDWMEVMEVKGVWRRERHAVVFYCIFPGYQKKEALLVVRNEQVEWSAWSYVWWFLEYPFLSTRSLISESPVWKPLIDISLSAISSIPTCRILLLKLYRKKHRKMQITPKKLNYNAITKLTTKNSLLGKCPVEMTRI